MVWISNRIGDDRWIKWRICCDEKTVSGPEKKNSSEYFLTLRLTYLNAVTSINEIRGHFTVILIRKWDEVIDFMKLYFDKLFVVVEFHCQSSNNFFKLIDSISTGWSRHPWLYLECKLCLEYYFFSIPIFHFCSLDLNLLQENSIL